MKKKRIPWNKGLTKETDERIARGAYNMAITKKGQKLNLSAKERQRRRDAMKGSLNPMFGAGHSEATKVKIREARARQVISEESNCKRSQTATCPYASNNIPKYDLYAARLEPIEECRRNVDDLIILEVRCTYCGKWFISSVTQVENRIGRLDNDSSRFYCSDSCKTECPIYRRHRYYKGLEGYDSREVRPELRQLVFELDGYTCQRCGSKADLQCHHIHPIKLNPIESADIDVCLTLCQRCHKWVHTVIEGCSYGKLAACNSKAEFLTLLTIGPRL